MTYSFEAHDGAKRRSLPYLYCKKCGLVALRNPFSQWAWKTGCNNELHPSYPAQRAAASDWWRKE